MGKLKPGATYIYESPDGGDTVYARELGKSERIMIGQNTRAKSLVDQIREDKLWGEIRRASESDTVLKEMINQIKVYYTLKKNTP